MYEENGLSRNLSLRHLVINLVLIKTIRIIMFRIRKQKYKKLSLNSEKLIKLILFNQQ